MSKKIRMSYIAVVALALVFGFASFVAIAKNDNDKSNSGDSSKSKSEKSKELKNYEKPTAEKTNASIYKKNTDEISAELLEVAEMEKNKGQQNKIENANWNKVNNPNTGEQNQIAEQTRLGVATEIEEVAAETEEAQGETVEAIEEVENQNGFKKFFVGTDYKNLGQLRSSLVQNRNQIRKLTKLSAGMTDEAAKMALTEQMADLMKERERIKTIISDNEEGFSLFGWVFRFMNGYQNGTAVVEQEETQLISEVETAIASADETAPVIPVETVPATPVAPETVPSETTSADETDAVAPLAPAI